ncbi:MAG: flagellar motor switch protein FliN [Acutalibacter sp.]|jgi:flagellar motor switch protein FliN/FliY
MEKQLFSPMEIDALGEMMNISLGSSATAVSNMLDQRVDITTPTVSVINADDFTLGNLEPAIGVEIKYVSGIEGSNIMLLKKSDIRVIVDLLMGTNTPEEEFELNDLTISAVCELMNQMMVAASTALSDFFGFPVNISTPKPFELTDLDAFKREHLPQNTETIVVVRFFLKIEGVLESEFMNVMSVSLARELLVGLGLPPGLGEETPAQETAAAAAPAQDAAAPAAAAPSGGSEGKMSQDEIEALLASMSGGGESAPAPQPQAPAPTPAPVSQTPVAAPAAQQPAAAQVPAAQPTVPMQVQAPAAQMPQMPGEMPAGAGQMGYPPPYYYPPYPYPMPQPAQPKVINSQPAPMPAMEPAETLGKEQAENLDLIMEVPLQVSVEIGRAQQKVQDILELSRGSLVVLDKLAGDQVDLFVNGKCIARGDVVVIDDNFGVRITEIVKNSGLEKALKME